MPPDEQGTAATAGKPQRLEEEVEKRQDTCRQGSAAARRTSCLGATLPPDADRFLHQQEGELANANVQIGILHSGPPQQEVRALQTVTTELHAEQERARGQALRT